MLANTIMRTRGSTPAAHAASANTGKDSVLLCILLSGLLCLFIVPARADGAGKSADCGKAPIQYSVTPRGEPFDPSRCKGGRKGFLYWAARGEVFAFPYDGVRKVYPSSGGDPLDKEGIPPAPDPREPPGCFGNPMRGGGLPLIQWHAMDSFCKLTGRPMDFGADSGHLWQGYYSIPTWHLADDQNEFNRKYFIKGVRCIERKSGIVQCEIAGSKDRVTHQVNYILKVPGPIVFPPAFKGPDIYVVLYNDLAASMSPTIGRAIRSSFDMYEAIRLRDRFRLFPEEEDLLVPYYKDLIAYVVNAHVPDYVWASSNNKQ